MKLFPPNYEAEETDFIQAWEHAIKFCLKNGYKINTEYGNESLDMCSRITLTGHSIYQIKNRQLHLKFPTRDKHLQEYVKQFTPEFDVKKSGFEYTYYDRLTNYPIGNDDCGVEYFLNQLENIRDNLKTSRRLQAIVWVPEFDADSEEPPCLQRIWIRVIDEPDTNSFVRTKGRVEVHLMWRSRDLYSAWMSNIVGIMFMLYNEVLGTEYEIVKLVDYCDSLHIYDSDWERARLV